MPRDRSKIVGSLSAKGFVAESKGRDHDFYFYGQGRTLLPVYTKVSRGSSYKSIGDELLARMAKQVHLTKPQFLDLVDCPMSQAQYKAVLIQKGVMPRE